MPETEITDASPPAPPEDLSHCTPARAVSEGEAMLSAAATTELEEWMAKHIHNSAISRDTALFNQVHAAKEALKAFLPHLDQ